MGQLNFKISRRVWARFSELSTNRRESFVEIINRFLVDSRFGRMITRCAKSGSCRDDRISRSITLPDDLTSVFKSRVRGLLVPISGVAEALVHAYITREIVFFREWNKQPTTGQTLDLIFSSSLINRLDHIHEHNVTLALNHHLESRVNFISQYSYKGQDLGLKRLDGELSAYSLYIPKNPLRVLLSKKPEGVDTGHIVETMFCNHVGGIHHDYFMK